VQETVWSFPSLRKPGRGGERRRRRCARGPGGRFYACCAREIPRREGAKGRHTSLHIDYQGCDSKAKQSRDGEMRVSSGAGAAVPSSRHVGAMTRAGQNIGNALLVRIPTGAGYLLGPPGAGSGKRTVLELDLRLRLDRPDCWFELNFGDRGLRATSGRFTGAHLSRRAERARMRVRFCRGGAAGWGSAQQLSRNDVRRV